MSNCSKTNKQRINIQRIKNDMDTINDITDTPNMGITRFSYSKEDRKARDYLIKEMEDLGLSIKIDGVGNIRAKYQTNKNINKSTIMIGSHIDTVPNGGRFDGLLGAISALEVIRTLKENVIMTCHPIELIIFAEEEGSNFGITMVGSKALTGKYNINDLKNIENDDGISGYEIMKNFGLDVDNIVNQILKNEEVKAMIEFHVEQGGVLDSENIPIGIVEAIVGMNTYKIKLTGVSNHAGTTPMNLRKDPMVAAAKVIESLETIAKEKALPTTVATVGKIDCKPNGTNVIPREVEFFVDIRDVDKKGIEIVKDEMENKIREIEKIHGVKSDVEIIGKSDCVKLSKEVITIIENAALKNNYKFKKMNSGAVHDAAMLAEITDVGMIFVPSIKGKSHSPEEDTKFEDIELGCNLLMDTVITLGNK